MTRNWPPAPSATCTSSMARWSIWPRSRASTRMRVQAWARVRPDGPARQPSAPAVPGRNAGRGDAPDRRHPAGTIKPPSLQHPSRRFHRAERVISLTEPSSVFGYGVAASMITYSVFRAVSGNPIPGKSAQLFTPQIDSWGPQQNEKGEPAEALGYIDAMALMRAHQTKRQTLLYPVQLSVMPSGNRDLPLNANGYAVTADFFSMFEVPFRYGGGWGAQEDDARASDVVISSELNQKLFGGADSVGRTLNLGGHDYHVVGVASHWNPRPRFYDLFSTSGFAEEPDFYMVFNRALDLKMRTNGRNQCRGAL